MPPNHAQTKLTVSTEQSKAKRSAFATPMDPSLSIKGRLLSSNTYHTEVHLIRVRVRIEHFRNPKDWILRIESIASARRVRFRQSTPFTRAFPKKRALAGTRTKPNPRRRARALAPHRTSHARIPLPTSPCIIIRVPWALRARPRIGSSLSSSSPRGDYIVVVVADAREEPPLSKKKSH